MKTQKMLLAAASLLLAACTPKAGETTTIVGEFAENAPETVNVVVGEQTDTTVAVTDGKFAVVVPTNLLSMGYIQAGDAMVPFIADGTTITVDPAEETATSSNKKGVQARYAAYNDWMKEFMSDYRSKMAGFGEDEDAANAYLDEVIGDYNDFQRKTIEANKDNFLGLLALSQFQSDDAGEMLSLIGTLTGDLAELPEVAQMKAAYQKKAQTGEGTPFVDFTVVQDPENPEASTVKLSDYVGKGKYILVDFWASWCGPCRAEMPNLIDVYNTYHGENFDMLSVAVWDKVEDTREAAEELGIVWNQIVNAQQIPTDLYGIEGIPHLILFGPDGAIVKRGIRGEAIGAAVREALGL